MATTPLPTTARRAVAALLAVWVVVLLVTLLGPSAAGPSWLVESVARVLETMGAPAFVTEGARVEFVLNAVAFAPVSLLGSLLWPHWTWRDWTAGGFVASFAVEAFQAVALAARSATYVDVVSNTLGALGGAVLAIAAARLLARTGERSEGGADLPHRTATAQQDDLPG